MNWQLQREKEWVVNHPGNKSTPVPSPGRSAITALQTLTEQCWQRGLVPKMGRNIRNFSIAWSQIKRINFQVKGVCYVGGFCRFIGSAIQPPLEKHGVTERKHTRHSFSRWSSFLCPLHFGNILPLPESSFSSEKFLMPILAYSIMICGAL